MTEGKTPQPPRARRDQAHRLKRFSQLGLDAVGPKDKTWDRNARINCGWGRLIFAQTFEDPELLAETLRAEGPDRRDIALYVRDPHVALAVAPHELFLDPSHTYRLELSIYRPSSKQSRAFVVRRLSTREDAEAVNLVYASRRMVPVPPEFFWSHRDARKLTVLVAEDADTGEILGTVMGVDHARAFNDPEKGSSLWCLAVSPQATHPGIGEALVRRLAEQMQAKAAAFMDLSVLHDNAAAIALYEKLGFKRVPVYAIKRKNPINEPLFTGAAKEEGFNPYAKIIVDEARRRGIGVEVIDAEEGYFTLSYGGRRIRCRESLTDLTSAVAMSICDDKRVTRRVVEAAGVQVPDQLTNDDPAARADFLSRYGSVVVKPARGEQGQGVAVGLTTVEEIEAAVMRARTVCEDVIVEEYFEGTDMRLVVIHNRVVAVALRRPARITGDGKTPARTLIEARSRRRAAATGGESQIPLDEETERCLGLAGYGIDDVVRAGHVVEVRKAANLHTGGTIDDVTEETHPRLIEAAVAAAQAIGIPVTGIDFVVKTPHQADYVFIEANERPGLANHEPQPTAARFMDLLFPLSVPTSHREAQKTRTK